MIDWTEQKYDMEYRPELIIAIQDKLKINDSELAKLTGINRGVIYRYRKGELKISPKYLPMLYAMAEGNKPVKSEAQLYVINNISKFIIAVNERFGIDNAKDLIRESLRNT